LQAELGVTEESRGDRRVEHGAKREAEVAPERRDIVVAAVNDLEDRRVGEDRRKGREVTERQWIHQARWAAVRRQLEQADLLGVVVQAVGLGIDAEGAAAGELIDERVELLGGAYPSGRGGVHGPPYRDLVQIGIRPETESRTELRVSRRLQVRMS